MKVYFQTVKRGRRFLSSVWRVTAEEKHNHAQRETGEETEEARKEREGKRKGGGKGEGKKKNIESNEYPRRLETKEIARVLERLKRRSREKRKKAKKTERIAMDHAHPFIPPIRLAA